MGLFDDLSAGQVGSTESTGGLYDALQEQPQDWEWKPVDRIKNSFQESLGALWGAGAALTEATGWDEARDYSLSKAAEHFELAAENEIESVDFRNIRNPLDAGKWTVQLITEYAPDLLMMGLGGAGLGSGAAKLASKEMGQATVETMLHKGFNKNLKDITKELGTDVGKDVLHKEAAKRTARNAGALLGVSGFEGTQGAGQAFLTDVDIRGQEDASGLAALGTGAGQAAWSLLSPLNRVLAGAGGKGGILKMTIGEAAEETGQEAIAMAHEGGVDPNRTLGEIIATEDGALRLLESGVAGALLGGTFGGPLNAMQKKGKDVEDKLNQEPEWKANLERIVAERTIKEKPEEILEASGIDTSGDAKISTDPYGVGTEPTAPVEILSEGTTRTQEPKSNIDHLTRDSLYEEQSNTLKEPVEETPYDETREVPQAIPSTEAQYLTPERQRSIQAAQEIDKVLWSELDTNNVEPEQIEVAKVNKVKEIVKETKADVAPTNLKEKQTRRVAEETAKTEILQVQENIKKETKGETTNGWTKADYDVEGTKVQSREKTLEDGTKLVVVKQGSTYMATKKEKGKAPEFLGKAKSVGAAEKLAEGTEAQAPVKQGRPKKTKEEKPLTEDQVALVSSLDMDKAKRSVMAKLPAEVRDDPEVESAFFESVMNAARTYKKDKGTSFNSHVVNTAKGSVLDLAKGPKEMQFAEPKSRGEGSETEGAEARITKKDTEVETTDNILPKKEKKIKEVTVGDKTITLTKDHPTKGEWYDEKSGKKYGTKADVATKKVKEELTPKVKKIDPKEYLKEQEAKKAKESKTTEADEKMSITRKAKNPIKEAETFKGETANQIAARLLERLDGDKVKAKVNIAPILRGSSPAFQADVRKQVEDINYVNIGTMLDGTISKSKGKGDRKSQALASLLKASIPKSKMNIKVVVDPNTTTAKYNSETNTVTLQDTSDLPTTLHEIVHAVTVREMEINKDLKKQVDGLYKAYAEYVAKHPNINISGSKVREIQKAKGSSKGFKELFKGEQFDGHRDVAYSLLNTKEFLSQAFSSSNVQEILKTIEVPEAYRTSRIQTIWDWIVDAVRSAFGAPKFKHNGFDRILQLTAELSDVKVPEGYKPTGKNTYEADAKPKKKTWEEKLDAAERGDLRGKPKDQLKDWFGKAGDALKDAGKGVTERLRKINPNLIRPLRKFEFNINNDNVKYQKEVKDFYDKYQGLSKRDQLGLDYSMMNPTEEYTKKRDEILKKNGMVASFKKVEKVLGEIYKSKESVGLNEYKSKPNYFPRRVKDIRGLMQAMKGDESYNLIQAEMDRLGEDATQADKEKAIQQMIHTGRFPSLALLKPTSSKKRKINIVSSEWMKYYENSSDALINHIYESNEAIHSRKLFGDTYRKQLVQERDKLYNELEGTLTDKKRKIKVGELQRIEEVLDNKDEEFTNGISQLLEKHAPELSMEQADEVIRLIRGRLTQKGMHGAWSTIRNISLMSVLSSPTSAITQIGDLAFSLYKYGPTDTVKAILGDKIINPEDLDLSGSMKEFQNEGTAKWLDRTLKWSGLQHMDRFGKTTTMNAAIKNAQKMSFKEFNEKYGHAYQEDTQRTYDDIKAGKNTEYSRYFAFNELSNLQPVSMSEMPLTYLTAGNGRMFYALKSYNIKAINTIYRESVHNWRTAKDSKGKAKAAKDVGRLILLMTFAGATADELKDMLLGKDAGSFSDNVHDNLLKIAMMSRYTLDQGFSKGIVETLSKDVLLPPTGFVDDPIRDVVKLLEGEPDARTLQNLPWGKLPYNWFSSTEEGKDQANLRKEILEAIKDGESIASQKSKVRDYNKWVRQYNKENRKKEDFKKKGDINYGVLTRARKEYLKNA